MDTSPPFRTFLAITLPPALLETIAQLQQRLQHRPGGQVIRWTKAGQIHLTLEFLGDVDAPRVDALIAAVQQACTGHAPFALSLTGLGCFPSPQRPSVVWVGVQGELDRLKALQGALHRSVQGFGDHKENREFQAHLTIGRIRPFASHESRHVADLIQTSAVGLLGEWRVDHVALIRSELLPEGPRYTELANVALR